MERLHLKNIARTHQISINISINRTECLHFFTNPIQDARTNTQTNKKEEVQRPLNFANR